MATLNELRPVKLTESCGNGSVFIHESNPETNQETSHTM